MNRVDLAGRPIRRFHDRTGRFISQERRKLGVLGAVCVLSVGCAATPPQEPSHAPPPVASPPPVVVADSPLPPAKSLAGPWKYLPYNGEGNMGDAAIDDSAWPAMDLPSSWFLLGKREYPPKANAMPTPFGDNAPGELWPVDESKGLDFSGTVWFRRTVDWEPGATSDHVVLDLDMVDYYGEVYVNGTSVGHHEGYFQSWSVDVTSALKPGQNLIAVKVSAPALRFDMSQQFAVSWPKMQNQVKGIFAYHDTRPGATSPRGQDRSTGGILRGLALRTTHGLDLSEITVLPLDVSEASARLHVEAAITNWSGEAKDVEVTAVIRPKNFTDARTFPVRLKVHAAPGTSRGEADIVVDHPQLWWSWDFGKPNLYQIDAAVEAAPSASGAAVFGIRSLTHDDNWVFSLNGKRIYLRGTNYIATQWLSQADAAFYDRDLKLMVDANLNTARVHAHLERPEFYDRADELGILVWQDFPLQWGYTDMPAFHEEALRQAADMVHRYADHPSIAVWCMHNESPFAMTWMKRKKADQNLALDEALTARAKSLDPSRIVHRDSGTGDGHHYYGWYDGKIDDAATAKLEPLITEYGASALPGVDTLKTMFDAKTLWPSSSDGWEPWKFANFQPTNTFEIAHIPRGKTIEELVKNTQSYQAALVRYQTELLRRRKWAGSTGVYQFMFVDDWPSITWSVLDYYRRPKLGYAALKESMARLLPSIEYDPRDPTKPIAIYVVNDLPTAIPGAHVSWSSASLPSKVAGERTLDIPADGVAKVVDLGALPALATSGRLLVKVTDARGVEVAHSQLGPQDFVERRSR